jgi:hypothetical protein
MELGAAVRERGLALLGKVRRQAQEIGAAATAVT